MRQSSTGRNQGTNLTNPAVTLYNTLLLLFVASLRHRVNNLVALPRGLISLG